MSRMESILREQFTTDITDPLVRIYQRAYESNSECYDPLIGHDKMVFGLMIHKSAKHFISQLAFDHYWLGIVEFNPRFVFRIKDFLISTYRVGDSIAKDIANSFPSNHGGAAQLTQANQRQLSLSFMDNGVAVADDSSCKNLILAHMGNPNDGLCRLFLGVPSALDEKQQISEWSSTFEIWALGDFGIADVPRSNPDSPVPPNVERTSPPTLTLRRISEIQKK
jgi:hypothetical protein